MVEIMIKCVKHHNPSYSDIFSKIFSNIEKIT